VITDNAALRFASALVIAALAVHPSRVVANFAPVFAWGAAQDFLAVRWQSSLRRIRYRTMTRSSWQKATWRTRC